MIAGRAEIVTSIVGALRLWKGDPQALELFDRSLEGFWRSFFAAVLAAPAQVLLLFVSGTRPTFAQNWPRMAAVETIAYVISWTAYPLAMVFVADWIGRGSRYFDYMVPYNWAGLVQLLVLLAAEIIHASGLLPEPISEILQLIAFIAVLHFQWFIARIGLEVSATAAVALVLMDLFLGVLIDSLAASIRG